MDDKQLKEFYIDQLIITIIGLIIFCIVMGIIYFIAITPHHPETLNECVKEIVGNCIIK